MNNGAIGTNACNGVKAEAHKVLLLGAQRSELVAHAAFGERRCRAAAAAAAAAAQARLHTGKEGNERCSVADVRLPHTFALGRILNAFGQAN